MNKTILEKMTFYDIVTLIVPGALVCCAWDWSIFSRLEPLWFVYVAQFGLLLMIGLLLKGISSLWSSLWFRNNTKMIREAELKEKNLARDIICTFVCGPIQYILSPIFAFDKANRELEDKYNNQYNEAYYNPYSGKRIELLESQVAFLQTWTWALGFCFIGRVLTYFGCKAYNWGIEWWILVLGMYACIVTMFILQKKIYQVVWDNMDAPNTKLGAEKTPASKEKKQGNESSKESLLTLFFWISTVIVVLMLIVFIFLLGINSQLSDNSSDWADFSTYIGAIGTMLFTAVYAYSFIQLQSAYNKSTVVQIERNQIDKEVEAERKNKKTLIVALAAIENSINACIDQLNAIKLAPRTSRLSGDNYTTLSNGLLNVKQNIDIFEAYYQSTDAFPKDNLGLTAFFKEMEENIRICQKDAEEWFNGQQPNAVRSIILANLIKTINMAKHAQTTILSTLL